MKIILPVVLICVLFSSCEKKETVFSEFQNLSPDVQWNKNDVKTFAIDIQDNSTPMEFVLAFRYATGYQFDKVIIRVTEVDPKGEKTIHDLEIPVRDSDGGFIGEKGYDIIDLEYTINAQKKYPQHGKYIYTVEQNIPGVDPLPFAMEVGLILRKDKEQR